MTCDGLYCRAAGQTLGALDGCGSGKGLDVGGARGGGEDQLGGGGDRVAQTASEMMLKNWAANSCPLANRTPRVMMDLVTTCLISISY